MIPHFMSNIYRIDYITGGENHHKHYQALDEETAISMFLAGASHKHTDLDSEQVTATQVEQGDLQQVVDYCTDVGCACGGEPHMCDRRYE